MPTRAVLFDRDDTLATTDVSVYAEAGAWLQQQYGLDGQASARILVKLWQERANDWWDLRSLQDEDNFWQDYGTELTRRLAIPAAEATQILHHFPYERYMRAVPEAADVLTELRRRGLKIGVLSNTLPSIDKTLKQLGLLDLVHVSLASCLLGVHKPDPRAFELAAEALEVAPKDILFIDDRVENIAAARQLGMRAERINLHQREEGTLHSLVEILDLIEPA